MPIAKMFTFKRFILRKQLVLPKIKQHVEFSSSIVPIKMSYTIYGDKTKEQPPPVIVLHGHLGSSKIWKSHCKTINENTKPKRALVAVDIRNHGLSPHSPEHSYQHIAADMKLLLLDTLKFKKAALLGYSTGGYATMYFTLKNPDLIEKLIVVDISPFTVTESFKHMRDITKTMLDIVIPTKGTDVSEAKIHVDNQLLATLRSPTLSLYVLTNLVKHSDGSYRWKANVPVLLEKFDNVLLFPNVGIAKFTGPTLFIVGGDSNYCPESDHAKIRNLFPKAQFKKIPHTDHWLHIQKSKEFRKMCAEFLNV